MYLMCKKTNLDRYPKYLKFEISTDFHLKCLCVKVNSIKEIYDNNGVVPGR